MPWLLNALYLVALLLASPWLLWRSARTGRYRAGLGDKLLGLRRDIPSGRVAWFHGVSVGEIHLLRQVIAAFRRRHPDWVCVVSSTTDTGLAEARKRFADLPVIAFPFDFSWAVRRTLRRVNPSLVVLAEGELWPNFLMASRRAGVPVVVVNGRMSPRSTRRYRLLGPLSRWLLGHVTRFLVQSPAYAANLHAIGVPPERVTVTGNVKYDGVTTDRHNPRTEAMRRLLGIAADDLVWVAGSTQPPEELAALAIYQRLQPRFPSLRLIVVPRQPDRFDEVAALLERSGVLVVRRSRLDVTAAFDAARSPVVLVDTMGELSAVWGLADVAFVGGSLDGRRGGQNMIEPAAYGAAVVFGPHVWNFRDAVEGLLAAGGACQVHDAEELGRAIERLLGDAGGRQRLGSCGQGYVLIQQGATERTMDALAALLGNRVLADRAA